MKKISIATNGERFYDVTNDVQETISTGIAKSGIVLLFCPHTSCALTVGEAYDESAKHDMENFLKHVAKRDLPFITHTSEGADDSPSHMKSMLLQQSIMLIVDKARVQLGTWQGIYLAEFRDQPRTREIWVQFLSRD